MNSIEIKNRAIRILRRMNLKKLTLNHLKLLVKRYLIEYVYIYMDTLVKIIKFVG